MRGRSPHATVPLNKSAGLGITIISRCRVIFLFQTNRDRLQGNPLQVSRRSSNLISRKYQSVGWVPQNKVYQIPYLPGNMQLKVQQHGIFLKIFFCSIQPLSGPDFEVKEFYFFPFCGSYSKLYHFRAVHHCAEMKNFVIQI